jgi:iron-sulfur cluster repair protein YtfE (RIC family)
MDPMATGLRYRLRRVSRQIAEQHAHMHELGREIERALEDQLPDKLKDVLLRFHAAMDAHFALEDGVFFPALHGLHPEQRDELEDLSRQHQNFGVEVERLSQRLEEGSLERFGTAFYELVSGLASHERREEKMVRAVADTIAASD